MAKFGDQRRGLVDARALLEAAGLWMEGSDSELQQHVLAPERRPIAAELEPPPSTEDLAAIVEEQSTDLLPVSMPSDHDQVRVTSAPSSAPSPLPAPREPSPAPTPPAFAPTAAPVAPIAAALPVAPSPSHDEPSTAPSPAKAENHSVEVAFSEPALDLSAGPSAKQSAQPENARERSRRGTRLVYSDDRGGGGGIWHVDEGSVFRAGAGHEPSTPNPADRGQDGERGGIIGAHERKLAWEVRASVLRAKQTAPRTHSLECDSPNETRAALPTGFGGRPSSFGDAARVARAGRRSGPRIRRAAAAVSRRARGGIRSERGGRRVRVHGARHERQAGR